MVLQDDEKPFHINQMRPDEVEEFNNDIKDMLLKSDKGMRELLCKITMLIVFVV